MRNKIKIIVVLLTLVFGVSSFPSSTLLLPRAGATYVEGAIVQDTLWTLVDSPFVIAKSITVYPNATLTIEPGVKIGFGGNFSFIVQGKMIADGTKERNIRFTSNANEPRVGDCGTISFVDSQASSMTYCIIEYANITGALRVENSTLQLRDAVISNSLSNGITVVDDGIVDIQNCNISHCGSDGVSVTQSIASIQQSSLTLCGQNGVTIVDSNLIMRENVLVQNNASGILLSGSNQATIQMNRLIANGNGIALTGNMTSGADVSQNIISASLECGILFNATSHSNIVISNNTISSNARGISILTTANTYLAYNYVSFNTIVGIEYREGSHTAYHNDIYGNIKGMDIITTNTTINAEHNYWGDASGPYHRLLNPNGRGNEAGGNGIDLDFIFFLTKSIGHVNIRPTANLWTDRVRVRPNETVIFFATDSSDEGKIDRYLFDFESGKNSGWTTLSVFTHKYLTTGTYNVNLTVMDDFGATSEMTMVTLEVADLPQLHADIGLSRTTMHQGEQISITVQATSGSTAINASVTLFSTKGGSFLPVSGHTNLTGFVTTFKTPNVTEIINIRITARASMQGYADGSDYEYLEVLPPLLSVQITPDSNTIRSEKSTQVIISVQSNGQPIQDVMLTISSDEGNISATTGTTDSFGHFSLAFTAPQTTQRLDATITASARKNNYIDGEDSSTITVEPKTLEIEIIAQPTTTLSEATVDVTIHITYETARIEGANVIVRAESGNFSQTSLSTNSNGSVTFVFTTPAVSESTAITITANASMIGYATSQNSTAVTVSPRTFNIKVEAIPSTFRSGEEGAIVVNVTCREDGKPVSHALVMITSDIGTFATTNKTTDTNGLCAFTFDSPQISSEASVTATISITKDGYISSENQTTVNITPRSVGGVEGSLSLITMLLIIIPIVIVVAVVALIKLKVITFSFDEET